MQSKANHPSEQPDDLNPEWTEYETRWAVKAADFEDPVAASRFLIRRKQIFFEAQRLGIPKDMLTAFKPNKPGFESRVEAAFTRLAAAARLPAE